MNIAMITNNYLPYVGGVPISVNRLARCLRERGHRVVIFAPHYPGELPEDGVIRFRTRRRTLGDGIVVPDMFDPLVRRTFRSMDFDLIHVHQPMVAGYMGDLLSRKYGVPLAMTYHTRYEEYIHYLRPFSGAEPGGPLHRFGRQAVTLHNRGMMNRCGLVFAPTYTMKRHLLDMGVRAPVQVLPTGLEGADFQVPAAEAARIRQKYRPEGGHLFCTVSRLSREKNQALLLRAMAEYRAGSRTPFHLLVIGDGPERENLTALRDSLGLTELVTFTGAIPHEQLPAWYGASDLFLFSSLSETQGLVLLEAMAAGLPVVALAATGVRDVVRDRINGRLTTGDAGAFALAVMDAAATGANLSRMAGEALATARQFQADRVAAAAESGYLALLEGESSDAVPVLSAAR